MKDFGIYSLLSKRPIWETSAILLSILAVIPIGKSVLDGFLYNISFTSIVGDPIGLVTALKIVIVVLQRGPVYVPQHMEKFLKNSRMHWLFAFLSFSFGVALHLLMAAFHGVTLMDTYHDLVVLPMFIYLGITLIPVMCFNGKRKEKFFFWGFITLWLSLYLVDVNNNLMFQHMWFYRHIYR